MKYLFKVWDQINQVMLSDTECAKQTDVFILDVLHGQVESLTPLIYIGIKDKNNKDICDGDNLRVVMKGLVVITEVIYISGGWYCVGENFEHFIFDIINKYKGSVEIVGNIYQGC